MWRLTLAQMRRTLGRLVAAGIAISLGTAFVAATLLASGIINRTTVDSLTAGYAQADLITTGYLAPGTAETLAAVPGVADVAPVYEVYVRVVGPEGATALIANAVAPVPELEPVGVVSGAMPTGPGEIALTAPDAERLGVALGEPVTVAVDRWGETPEGEEAALEAPLTVVGLLDSDSLALFGQGTVRVDPRDLATWSVHQTGEDEASYWTVLATVDPGADVAQVRQTAIEALPAEVTVNTKEAAAEARLAEITGETQVLTGVVMGFAAISLLVAALVIANTFQVIVAQRTRTLALLRCVGATKAQLRRSVLFEAAVLGLAASALGVVLGIALVQGLLLGLTNVETGVPLPTTVSVSVGAVVVPILVGLAVTTLAAMTPARAATRVSPLAALQPVGAARLTERAGRFRAWAAGVLTVGGALGLVGGVLLAREVDLLIGLLLGVLGGAASFVGVLVGAVFWVPRAVAVAGALLSRLTGGPGRASSVPARLAAANSVRNPRRTAATSAALFIGVTLVAMMSTGAATAREAFTATLDESYPVDVDVRSWSYAPGETGLPDAFFEDVAAVSGVSEVAAYTLAPAQIGSESVEAVVVDPVEAARVVNAPEMFADLADGTAVFGNRAAERFGVVAGEEVVLQLADWATGGTPGEGATVVVAVVAGGSETVFLTPADAARVTPDLAPAGAFVAIDGGADPRLVVEDLQDLATASGDAIGVTGLAVEREFFDQVVDTLLAVVVGLLAVSVVIALVGVSNTLSLSVLERRRESATLRAIGLTRNRLRASLAAEGVLVALVGAVVGGVLGTLYGWAGVRTVIGGMAEVPWTVAWRDLGLVLLVAVGAGLLASVAPARTAVRTSPVVALAVD